MPLHRALDEAIVEGLYGVQAKVEGEPGIGQGGVSHLTHLLDARAAPGAGVDGLGHRLPVQLGKGLGQRRGVS